MKVISKKTKYYHGSLPDIDIDFGSNPILGVEKRTLIEYLQQKYNHGNNIHVASVGNLNTYSLPSAIQDLASTFEIPTGEYFPVTKAINEAISLDKNIKKNEKIAAFFQKYPDIKELAEGMVGVGRNLSVHAGGVVITDKQFPLNRYCPLQRTKEDDVTPATMFTKDEIQDIGLVKMDLLGLNTLTQIEYVKWLLNGSKDWGKQITEDYDEDPQVFEFIKEGLRHKNIFQFETPLGKKCFKDLKMESILDLANASGMIRVMGSEDGRKLYNSYKENSEASAAGVNEWEAKLADEVSSDNFEICKEVLGPTYGVLIYQEQLIKLIERLSDGKLTFNDGNDIRKKLGLLVKDHGLIDTVQTSERAIKAWHADMIAILGDTLIPYLGKDGLDSNDPDIIDFINCNIRTNGKKKYLPIPEKGILNWFIVGSTYLFSIIHSVGYSVITYNQMYQKTYHPTEFWIAALSIKKKYDEFIPAMASESGISILRPDINESDYHFSNENGDIRYGLSAIMSLDKSAGEIIKEREKGPFKSVKDFCERTAQYRSINKKTYINLMRSEAFAEFGNQETIFDELQKNLKIKLDKADFSFSKQDKVIEERKLLTCNIIHVSEAAKKARNYTGINELQDGLVASCSFTINKVLNKVTKTNKPYILLMVTCLKNGTNMNLFCWNGDAAVKEGMEMVAPIIRKGDFHTIKI